MGTEIKLYIGLLYGNLVVLKTNVNLDVTLSSNVVN
jgi:hypothetical protein